MPAPSSDLSPTPSSCGFAPVNGTQLYYEIRGVTHPETLVMVHAGICDHRMWQPQVAHFARRYRVLTYDMRGFGESPIGEGPFAFYADLHGLLTHLNIERAILMGCSQGGLCALDFALAYPAMARALVLSGAAISGYHYDGPPHPLNAAIEAAYERGDLEATSELEVRLWVDGEGRGADEVDPAVRDLVRAMNLIPLNVPEDAWDREQTLDPPALTRLEDLHTPTLLIIGDLDVASSLERTALLAARLPDARKVVMPGTAHLPNLEQPAHYNGLVENFLRTLEDTP